MNTKLITTALAAALLATGCTVFVRTAPVAQQSALEVPQERVRTYQESLPGYAKVIVTRDAGFMGGGCYIGLVVSGALAARFDPGEKAIFFIPSGKSEMAVVPDPEGQGLCGIAAWDPVIEHYDLKSEGVNLFRISLGAYRRPRLLPTAY